MLCWILGATQSQLIHGSHHALLHLFVTIAEIHMLILDVYVCLHKIISKVLFLLFSSFGFIENAVNMMLYKASAAIINKANLTQKLGSI